MRFSISLYLSCQVNTSKQSALKALQNAVIHRVRPMIPGEVKLLTLKPIATIESSLGICDIYAGETISIVQLGDQIGAVWSSKTLRGVKSNSGESDSEDFVFFPCNSRQKKAACLLTEEWFVQGCRVLDAGSIN